MDQYPYEHSWPASSREGVQFLEERATWPYMVNMRQCVYVITCL